MSDVQQSAQDVEQQARLRRRSAQQTLAANRRNICATGFDFLDGSFKAAARLRMVSIVVAGVVVILNMLIVARGLGSTIEASSVREQRVRYETEYRQQVIDFGNATGLDAERNKQFLQRDEVLSNGLIYIVGQQQNLPQLLSAALAIPEVRVVSIEFNTAKPASQSVGGTSATTVPKAAAPAAAGSAVVSFTITAESDDFSTIKPWVESLRSSKYLIGVQTQREGKKVIVLGSFKGSVPSSASELLASLRLQLPQDEKKDASAPAGTGSTATTQPSSATTVPATNPAGTEQNGNNQPGTNTQEGDGR